MINLKKVDTEKLLSQINHAYQDADNFRSEQADNYQNAWDYYLKNLPKSPIQGGSTFTAPVVKQAVDKLLPPQMGLFTGSDNQAVSFRPQGIMIDKDGQVIPAGIVADAVNDAINKIFLRENNGYEIYSDAFTEALITGGAYLKWYVVEDRIQEDLCIDDWVPATILKSLLLEYPDSDFSKMEKRSKTVSVDLPNEMRQEVELATGSTPPSSIEQSFPEIKGKIDLLRIERKIKVIDVPFGEMFIDPTCVSVDTARYLCHRKAYPVVDLLEMGFNKDAVMNADLNTSDDDLNKRKIMVDGKFTDDSSDALSTDPMERKVYLYEHYIYSSLIDKKGHTKLYRVFATNSEILEVEEVQHIPFAHGKAISIPGSFIGDSIYNLMKDIQDFKSEFFRLQSDSARIGTYGRYTYLKGAVDVRALADGRFGGLVEVSTPGAVAPLPISGTTTDFENIYGKVQEEMNTLLGSSASEAFDPSSLNNTTAAAVSMVMGNQELKDKRIGGTLARTMVKPMFEGIYRLLRNEAIDLQLPNGSVFNTSKLPKVANFVVDINTTNDDAITNGTLTNILQLDATVAANARNVNTNAIIRHMLKTSTGMSEDMIEQYVPTPKPPTEEQLAEQAKTKALEEKVIMSNLQLVEAQTRELLIKIAKEEALTSQVVIDKTTQRLRDKEDSMRKFSELELKHKELGLKFNAEQHKAMIDEEELILEAQQDRPVLIGE